MLIDSRCIEGNISQVPRFARTIIAHFGGQHPGNSPTMHRESADIADI